MLFFVSLTFLFLKFFGRWIRLLNCVTSWHLQNFWMVRRVMKFCSFASPSSQDSYMCASWMTRLYFLFTMPSWWHCCLFDTMIFALKYWQTRCSGIQLKPISRRHFLYPRSQKLNWLLAVCLHSALPSYFISWGSPHHTF